MDRADEASIGFIFWSLHVQWKRSVERVLAPYDLTHAQFIAMAVIDYLKNKTKRLTQVMVANTTGFDINMTSQVLRTLEKKGFITREKVENDQRIRLITLTQLGNERLRRGMASVEQADNRYFGVLGDTERDFYDCLQYLLSQNRTKLK